MKLTTAEATQLNRALLAQLQLKFVDKEQSIIPFPGKTYHTLHPASESVMGSIGPQPDPAYDGPQAPNAMGMVLLVTPDDDNMIRVGVSGQFDVIHRCLPDLAIQRRALVLDDAGDIKEKQHLLNDYRRLTVVFDDVDIVVRLAGEANQWIRPKIGNGLEMAMSAVENQLINDPRIFKRCHLSEKGYPLSTVDWHENAIVTQADFESSMAAQLFSDQTKVLPYQVGLRVRARPAPRSLTPIEGAYLLEIFLENQTPLSVARAHGVVTKAYLLDVQFQTHLEAGQGHNLPHRLSPEDYRYQGGEVPGYGVTTSVEQAFDDPNVYYTNAMPISELEDISNSDSNTVGMLSDPDFKPLSQDPGNLLRSLLDALDGYVAQWEVVIEAIKQAGRAEDAAVSSLDLVDFKAERDRVRDGVELLESDESLLRCFRWMNECMLGAVKRQGKDFTTWRLFQLGFILTQIRAVFERCCKDSEVTDHLKTAEVLWFPTGGGKTEAYLGIILMGMLYERLKGRSYGITAWMKFPFRMLSVQQFQRLAYVVAQANIVRQREKLGGHPYTVGYFTGEGTPSNITSTSEYYQKSFLPNLDKGQLAALKFVSDCPYCDAADSIVVQADIAGGRLKHCCTNLQCWSNTHADRGEYGEGIRGELGIYVSDEEVYRYIPTIMVGTIDKLVNIGHNRRFRKFFGGVTHFCPLHGFLAQGKCDHRLITQTDRGDYENITCPNNSRTSATRTRHLDSARFPGVSFVLQDELHLLAENTGNFGAHYESLMVSIQEGNGGRRPKILSATATIRDYEHHVHHLYQLEAKRFPVPGHTLSESFYARKKQDATGQKQIRRLYAGILPLGHGGIVASSSAQVSSRYLDLIDELRLKLVSDPAGTVKVLGLSQVQAGDLKTYIERFHNTCLIYINNVRGTTDVKGQLDDMQSTSLPRREVRILDGKSSLEEIQDTIRVVESKGPDDPVRQMVATSVVSHGVDISTLNFMVVGGWPKSSSEYLQSSARAGRVEPGIVVTILDNRTLFQSSVFMDFRDYHRFLDRMVESVPINRFAPNLLDRTLPGVVCACVLNWAAGQPWGADITDKAGKIMEALRSDPSVREALKERIIYSLAVPPSMHRHFDSRVVTDFMSALHAKTASTLTQMENMLPDVADMGALSQAIGRMTGHFPMMSLRDIESQVGVDYKNNDATKLFDALARGW